jgi:hypothetical protein
LFFVCFEKLVAETAARVCAWSKALDTWVITFALSALTALCAFTTTIRIERTFRALAALTTTVCAVTNGKKLLLCIEGKVTNVIHGRLLALLATYAAEMTSVNVQQKDLYGQQEIGKEHVDNNAAVRDMLLQRGIVPEQLPTVKM